MIYQLMNLIMSVHTYLANKTLREHENALFACMELRFVTVRIAALN